jgi:hypothetical protein
MGPVWSAVTCHRFCLGRLDAQVLSSFKPVVVATSRDGQSGDRSPHSKNERLFSAVRPSKIRRMSPKVTRREFVSAALASAAIAAAAPAGLSQSRIDRPNILFILADDLGYGDLSCYGRPDYQTPHLDRLATQGVRFVNAYSASSVCTPTRCAFITGRYPARTRIGLEEPLTERGSEMSAALSGVWKYVNDGTREYLFNLSFDEREQKNFSEENPEMFARLRDEFKKWDATVLPRPPARRRN